MTLSEQNDYNLDAFNIQSFKECFSPIYGPNGTGDITDPINHEYFIRNVINDTKQTGVHVVCADGGLPVNGQENFQEQLAMDLYLCQCFTGLSVLRKGGVFVCKFFDVYSNFSASLIYLLHACFKEITIYKPVTSRPGNSERYFVGRCLHSIEKTQPIFTYLCYLIKYKFKLELHNLEVLPWSFMMSDIYFYEYYRNRMYDIEYIQIKAVEKILYQLQKISPQKFRAIPINNILSFWNIHFNTKNVNGAVQHFRHPNQIYNNLIAPYDGEVILSHFIPSEKTMDWYQVHFSNNSTWYFLKLCESNTVIKCTLYACFIKAIVHSYIDGKWVYNNLKINLPLNTIVLGALVNNTLYILDAVIINGFYCVGLTFKQRQSKIQTLTQVISTISDGRYYKHFIKIDCVDFVPDILSNQISIEKLQLQNKNQPNDEEDETKIEAQDIVGGDGSGGCGDLCLAINEHFFVDKCLFYK